MGLKAGIVGLPNVGKSTLFNAITNSQVLAENYPFATIEPTTGVVEVPDPRLDRLVPMFNSRKRIAATFEFTDIAGLVRGAARGEGLGNQFLAAIREVDAICHVVRCFDDPEVIHVDGDVDPRRDIETINFELIMADLETVEKRLSRIAKKATTTKEPQAMFEYQTLELLKSTLEKGLPARSLSLDANQERYIRTELHLMSLKPVIYVANVSADDLLEPEANRHFQTVREVAAAEGNGAIAISIKIEEEIAKLDDPGEFMAELGLGQSGLERLISIAYATLGLKTFFTCGEMESRAWTFKDGDKAPACAGYIHTDFERGFIRAEVYSYDDLIACGGEAAVKDAGKWRLEGREYLMKDGDIVHFRFNVAKKS